METSIKDKYLVAVRFNVGTPSISCKSHEATEIYLFDTLKDAEAFVKDIHKQYYNVFNGTNIETAIAMGV